MPSPAEKSRVVHFGLFEVDLQEQELRKSGIRIKLQEQPFQILAMLLEHRGQTVTREELRQKLWPTDTFVDFDHSLNSSVKKLRLALGDDSGNPRFIETLHRRGYRFIAPVDGPPPPTVAREERVAAPERTQSEPATTLAAEDEPVSGLTFIVKNKALLAIVGGIVMLSVAGVFWYGRTKKSPESTRIAPTIAVLPFSDLSAEKNQEYFSDGLAEELLNDLAKIPQLRVTARTSSFQFKSKNEDLRSIGQKLNVSTILEGSVRKEGRRVRITAQLINAADGFHIWSETYDRELNDVFAVQANIARSVAASLKIELLGTELPAPHVTNEEAYNAYLQGQYFYQQRGKDNFEKAAEYYQKAITLDPSYAPAWAELAWLRARQGDWGYLSTEEAFQKGWEAVERALALDKNLADAHAVMGYIHTSYDWEWAAADDSYKRALALEPGNVRAVEGAAALAGVLGRSDESLRLFHRLAELNPLDATSHIELGAVLESAGHLEEAIAALRKALELNPESPTVHMRLGLVYLLESRPEEALAEMELEPDLHWRLYGLAFAYQALGRRKEADTSLTELISKYGSIMAYQIAEVYADRKQVDLSFEWLERAYVQRDTGLISLATDPALNILKHDPRYGAFLKKMHLA